MPDTATDCRCKACNALLAKQACNALSIRRGRIETRVSGADFAVGITCYRCHAFNVFTSTSAPAGAR